MRVKYRTIIKEYDRVGESDKRDIKLITHPVTEMKQKRGVIKQMSKTSAGRLKLKVRNKFIKEPRFITLTYAKNMLDGRIAKKHLNSFLTNIRKRFPKIKYLWVMEFQKRGAIHFHIVINRFIPFNLLKRIWKHGRTRIEYIRKSVEGYIAYMYKESQKVVTEKHINVGRFWGDNLGKLECLTIEVHPFIIRIIKKLRRIENSRKIVTLYDVPISLYSHEYGKFSANILSGVTE